MNRVANSRHQLSTLLKQAYDNREALEEKIAQGKRNRKEAGNKYGKGINYFSYSIVTERTIRRLLIASYYLYEAFLEGSTLTKPTIPMMFPSQHHSWIV